MDLLRVLDEKAETLTDVLTRQAGFTADEARRFLWEATPALAQAYEWSTAIAAEDGSGAGASVRDLLGSVPGRTLARSTELPASKVWAGLRLIAPHCLEAALEASRSLAQQEDGGQEVDPAGEEPVRFEIGFGMTMDGEPRGRGAGHKTDGDVALPGMAHPIFDHLLR
jgi:hypothetical protein